MQDQAEDIDVIDEEEFEQEDYEQEEELEEEQDDSEDDSDSDEDESEDESEVVVSIDGETPPQEEDDRKAPKWVKELRKAHREQQKENRDLKAKLEALTSTETKPVELGKKPKLEDFDYDADKFEVALTGWYEKKREHDERQEQAKAEQKRQESEWQSTLDAYSKKKSELKVRDFDDAESTVQDAFSTTQQGVIIQGAENPALVIYALGTNPKRLKELSSIKDPVKFAFAVAKLETQLKISNRKASTKPEKTVSGSGRSSGVVGSADSTLERLREEASKTGDFSKVTAYKRKQAAKK